MPRIIGPIALLILVPFVAVLGWLIVQTGPIGFLHVAAREPWAAQLLVDLLIASGIYLLWLVPDARRHGIPAWPYVVLTLTCGSVGGLSYLVHRWLVTSKDRPGVAAAA